MKDDGPAKKSDWRGHQKFMFSSTGRSDSRAPLEFVYAVLCLRDSAPRRNAVNKPDVPADYRTVPDRR